MTHVQVDEWVVLLVDDVSDYLEVTQIALSFQGVSVHTAQNIEDAWELLQTMEPHVILLDMHMPGGDGSELLHRLRGDSRYAHIPVIAATAYATVHREKRYLMDLGFDGYIAKPFSTADLINRVRDVIN